jgi:hypothetical protein
MSKPSTIKAGDKFGKLTVIKKSRSRFDYRGLKLGMWLCKCNCEGTKIVSCSHLKNGSTKSCGCLVGKRIYTPKFSHNLSKARIYKIWHSMKQRCLNPNDPYFNHYGGRGIKLTRLWKNFIHFKKDMYESYIKHVEDFGEKQTTIERIDVNGGYNKKNCTWATWIEQNRNKRKHLAVK